LGLRKSAISRLRLSVAERWRGPAISGNR
jgi:hypothetical protein